MIPLKSVNPKRGSFANSDISSRSAVFAQTKVIFGERNSILFGNYNL